VVELRGREAGASAGEADADPDPKGQPGGAGDRLPEPAGADCGDRGEERSAAEPSGERGEDNRGRVPVVQGCALA